MLAPVVGSSALSTSTPLSSSSPNLNALMASTSMFPSPTLSGANSTNAITDFASMNTTYSSNPFASNTQFSNTNALDAFAPKPLLTVNSNSVISNAPSPSYYSPLQGGIITSTNNFNSSLGTDHSGGFVGVS